MKLFQRIFITLSFLLFFAHYSSANVLYVTNTNDAGPGSFRDQCAAAFANDSVVFNVSGNINLQSTLVIDKEIKIIGPTAKYMTINLNNGDIRFNTFTTDTIFISYLRFTKPTSNSNHFLISSGAKVKFEYCVFDDMITVVNGGAIEVNGANSKLIVNSCSFFGNTTQNNGGAIFANNDAECTVKNSTFNENNAASTGGCISLNATSTLIAVNNTFHNNNNGIIYAISPDCNIIITNNIFSSNTPTTMLIGTSTWNGLGGNVYTSTAGILGSTLTTLGINTSNDIFSGNQANLQLRAIHVTDGYGLKWFPVINSSGSSVENGVISGYITDVDGRRAPRIIDGDIDGAGNIDAGACEYTPYRVTSNSGAGDFESIFTFANSNISGTVYIEFDCSPSGTHITSGLTTTYSGKWIIDGFTQFGSAVPGPSASITAVTPGQFPNVISSNSTLLSIVNTGFGTTISGLAFDNEFTTSIFINNTQSVNIFGNLFFSTAASNADKGVHVFGGNNHTIGGSLHLHRNVLNNHFASIGSVGILIEQSDNTKVFGNFIGTNANGTSSISNDDGVIIGFAASNTQVGSSELFQKNIISGNFNRGIGITVGASTNNKIESNYIGLNYAGTASLPNTTGISVEGNETKIGNFNKQSGNVISGNTYGIQVFSEFNEIHGNIIGLNPTTDAAFPNTQYGISIESANNQVGFEYLNLAQRNVISGNGIAGIYINGINAVSNTIQGNLIGPFGDEASSPVTNQNFGIHITNQAYENYIGSANLDNGNVVSGNGSIGIALSQDVNTISIQSNNIGVDKTESIDLPNGTVGIQLLNNCTSNIINYNMVARNGTNGIEINSSNNNTIFDNVIGCNRDVTANFGNTESGITLFNSSGTYIEENNIHSNGLFGIDMLGSNNTQIYTNYIGGNASSLEPYVGSGNGNRGIYVDQSDSVQIGDGTLFRVNYIKFNNGDGITIDGGSSLVQHTFNLISDNAGLGIDIDADGVSVVPTDNEGAQAPVFTGAVDCSGAVTITGTLNGTPSTMYRLDFYKNTTPDASGSGEGETYIEKTYVITDGAGVTNFNHIFSSSVSVGDIITAIASDSINGFPIRNSSEFAVNIMVQSSPSITLVTSTNESCSGTMDGSIDVSVSGGITPYTYTWYNSSAAIVGSNEDVFGLGSDNYYLELEDAIGCIINSAIYNITSPPAFTVSVSTTDVSCFGLSDGTATSIEVGGTGPFTYIWTPSGQTTQTATGLSSNTHSVTVTDALGCTAFSDGFVSEPAQIIVTLSKNDPVCNGTSTGSGIAAVSGGVPTFNYLWTPGGANTSTATGLAAGTFTCQVTDANGCIASSNITLIDPTPVASPTVPNRDICNGDSRLLSITSPVGGITYRWYGTLANAIANISQLGIGTTFTPTLVQAPSGQRTHFYVTATDGAGCVSTPTDVTLTHRTVLTQPAIISGPANLCPSGNYTYSIATPPPTISITDAVTSNFNLVTEYFWSVPAGWTINSGQGTQNINVTASGTVSGGNISVVTRYVIPTSLATTCNSTARTLAVNVRARPTVNITPDPYTICEGVGGTINGNPVLPAPAGGFTPTILSNLWAGSTSILNSTTVANPSILAVSFSGSYSLNYAMTANFGSGVSCTSLTDFATVNILTQGTVNLVSQTNVSCIGANDGAVNINITGGVGPFTYNWNSGLFTTQNISGLSPGNYQLTVTDANGCVSISPTYTITEPAILNTTVTPLNETCLGSNNGSSTLTINSGGVGTFTAQLFNSSSVLINTENSIGYSVTRTFSGLIPDNYFIVVTHSSGCDDTLTFGILPGPTLTSFFTAPASGCENSTINFTDASSNTPTAWQWDFGDLNTSTLQNPTHTYTSAGVYTVTLTTFWGACSEVHTDNITINVTPVVTNSNTLTVCSNDPISIPLSATVISTFTWTASYVALTGGAGSGSGDINEILQNITSNPEVAPYSVIPTSSFGCVGNPFNINVTVNPEPVYSGPTSFTICSGDALSINLTSPIASTWNWDATNNVNVGGESITNQTTSSITDVLINSLSTPENVTYNVQPTSLLGCANSYQTITVTVNPIPATPTITTNSPVCEGGTLSLTTPLVAGAAYAWSGPNGFSSNLQNPSIVGISNAGAGTYSLVTTLSGCNSSTGTSIVTIDAAPTTSNAGLNQNICASSSSTNLTANTPTIGTGLWSFVSGPGSPTIITPSDPNTLVVGLSIAGSYIFEWTISNGTCTPSTSQVTITTIANPATPVVTSNSPLCEGDNLLLSTPLVAGASYSWTGPSGFTSILQNPTISSVTTSNAGTYSLNVTVNGCTSVNPGSTAVSINPTPTTATAGADQNVCINVATATMGANTPIIGSGAWSFVSGPTTPSFINNTDPTTNINGLNSPGTYIFEWVISSVGCTPSTSQVMINIDDVPTTANAGLDTTACETLGAMTFFGNSPIVGTGVWTQISGTGTTIASPTSNITSVSGLATAGTYVYEWTISNGVCSSSTDQKIITLSSGPTIANAGAGQSICISTASATMAANTPSIGTGTWNYISGPSTPTIVTFSDPNTVINNLNAAGSYVFEWAISSVGCTPSTSQVTINVDDVPTFSDAGLPQSICAGNDTVIMNANTPLIGTGSWMQISGGSSIIGNTSSPTTIITGFVTPGTYVYDWVIGNGSCPNSSDQVTITVEEAPTISVAGTNQDICVSAAATTLAANSPIVGTGTWSFVSGPSVPTFVSINSPTTNANGFMMPGVYVLEWTISNGSCTPSSSQVSITVNDTPTTAVAGSDQTICSTTSTVSMNANSPFVGLGSWTQVSGPVSTIVDVNSPTTVINGLTTAGVYDFQWEITNGTCTPSTDVVTITVNEGPTVNTSAPNNVCASESSFNVLGTQNNATSVQWSILSGSGSLSSTTTNASVYTLNINDQGTTVILLFEGVASGCANASDTVSIVIDPIPNAPTTIDNLTQSICEGTTVNLSASTTTTGANIFWFSNAGLTNQIGVGANVTLGPIVLNGNAYVVSSLNGCVNNNPLIFNLNTITNSVEAGDSVVVCIGSTATLNGTASGNFYWMNEVGLSDTSILNPTVNPIVDTYYYLVSNNGGCSAMDSVLVYIGTDCESIQVTNTFSPNGDGVNEFFTIDGLINSIALRVTIINRWGDVIADIPNYDNLINRWDGTYNGTPVPEGTYFYIIEYMEGFETSTGWVQVIR